MDGQAILQAAKDHYKKKLTEGLRSFVVDEWGPAEIFYPPSLSLHRMARLNAAIAENSIAAMADMVIEIARDENGKPLFSAGMRNDMLKETDGAVVKRVAERLAEILVPTEPEDVAGN